jgi:hypothetical protein
MTATTRPEPEVVVPPTGPDLTVDTDELRAVATDLNNTVDDFSTAATLIGASTPPNTSSPPWVAVVPEWLTFQGLLAALVRDTATNVSDTATALTANADSYDDGDRGSATGFQRLRP